MSRIAVSTILMTSTFSVFAKSPKFCTHHCTYSDVDFSSDELRGFRFDKKEFENVGFNRVNLSDVSFESSALKNVKFVKSNLTFTAFNGAKINSSIFDSVWGDNYLEFKNAKISNSTFKDLKVKNLDMRESIISHCSFDVTSWDKTLGIYFNKAQILGSSFVKENFSSRIDLSGAMIKNSNFTDARFLSKVTSVGLKIEDSLFNGVYFSDGWLLDVKNSNFTGITIEGNGGFLKCQSSNFSGSTIKNKGFRISSADHCDFSNADLSGMGTINFQAVKASTFCNAKMPDGTIGKCEK